MTIEPTPLEFLGMVLSMSQTYEDCAQHGEHVGLNECYKQFKTIHEHHHDETDNGERSTNDSA